MLDFDKQCSSFFSCLWNDWLVCSFYGFSVFCITWTILFHLKTPCIQSIDCKRRVSTVFCAYLQIKYHDVMLTICYFNCCKISAAVVCCYVLFAEWKWYVYVAYMPRSKKWLVPVASTVYHTRLSWEKQREEMGAKRDDRFSFVFLILLFAVRFAAR